MGSLINISINPEIKLKFYLFDNLNLYQCELSSQWRDILNVLIRNGRHLHLFKIYGWTLQNN